MIIISSNYKTIYGLQNEHKSTWLSNVDVHSLCLKRNVSEKFNHDNSWNRLKQHLLISMGVILADLICCYESDCNIFSPVLNDLDPVILFPLA